MVADRTRRFHLRLGWAALAVGWAAACLPAAADEATTIRVGVRGDAPPFSARVTTGPASFEARQCDAGAPGVTYRGYSVDLCRDFIGHMQKRYPGKIDYCFVEVVTHRGGDAPNRFDALSQGGIDMLCGATTATLEVLSRFRASLPTFLSTSTFLYNTRSVSQRVGEQVPLRIGVLSNSTSDGSTNPDADVQHAAVRTALGSVGLAPPVMFDSHLDVIEMLCEPDDARTGCRGGRPDTEIAASAADAQGGLAASGGDVASVGAVGGREAGAAAAGEIPFDCGWKMNRPMSGWVRYLQCPRNWEWIAARLEAGEGDGSGLGETVDAPGVDAPEADQPPVPAPDDGAGAPDAESAGAPDAERVGAGPESTGPERTGEGDTQAAGPSPFERRRASREIDVYISDRPILQALLDRAQAQQIAAGIELSNEPLISQPYAIVFPPGDIARRAPAAAFGDLHLEFNRFLVEQFYAPDQRGALNSRLDRYFATTVDRSFINMLPILARWPTGASLGPAGGAAPLPGEGPHASAEEKIVPGGAMDRGNRD